MTLPSKEFDAACKVFADALIANGQRWKDYFGAAYSTRMQQAVNNVRKACDEMEEVLRKDNLELTHCET